MTTTTNTSQGQLMYAVQDCSRCGGSGSYSYCAQHGTRCFKCQGKGLQLTGAARKARELVTAWKAERATVAVESVQVGQLVRMAQGKGLVRVLEVHVFGESGVASIHPDGTRTEHMALGTKGMSYSFAPGSTVQRQLDEAERAELDTYMDTLPGVFRQV